VNRSPAMRLLPTLPRPRGNVWIGLLVGAVVVVALAIFPQLVKKPYAINMGAMLFLAIIMGQAWNVIGGYAGQYSVGHAAYFGAGAYTTMMLLELNQIAPWWGIWAGMVNGVLVSLVIGTITFRLRGPYFVLASISMAEILRYGFLYFRNATKGAEGFVVSKMPKLEAFGATFSLLDKRTFYYATLVLALVAILVNWLVQRSKLGYYFQAIREDQDAAHSLGINPTFYKSAALAISAALTALAGGIQAMLLKVITPDGVFGIDLSVQVVLICIIGGIGTILGPVIGAALLIPLAEMLRNPRGLAQIGLVSADSGFVQFIEAHLSNAHLLVYGILVVIVILFAPDGILGVIRRIAARLRRRRASGQPAANPAGA
jgi:branched-chain amino acid transport system permease protein